MIGSVSFACAHCAATTRLAFVWPGDDVRQLRTVTNHQPGCASSEPPQLYDFEFLATEFIGAVHARQDAATGHSEASWAVKDTTGAITAQSSQPLVQAVAGADNLMVVIERALAQVYQTIELNAASARVHPTVLQQPPSPLFRAAIFQDLATEGLAALSRGGVLRTFQPGQVLLQQGEVGRDLYVLQRGRVVVSRVEPGMAEPVTLAVVYAGGVVGEIGLLDGWPRTATVTALEETQAIEISDALLAESILRYPAGAIALLHIVSTRLRNMDDLVGWYVQRQAP